MINIAVLGHGVVGSGVVEVINTNQENIARSTGDNICVKRILDLREFDVPYAATFTKDYNDILNDDEISIVVEVMGGINPAFDFVKSALLRGKSVVTSNKELVADKGAQLLALAKEHNVNFYFEASVGGGIPIIRPMHLCLAANKIDAVAGILNGTTNFILTKMINENMSFDVALKLAQDSGFAERDPSADVDGKDACRKICILASLAYGKQVQTSAVHTEGIRGVRLEDVSYAASNDMVIKLLGMVRSVGNDDELECMVCPAFIKKQSQLAGIEDVFNGILVRGNATGDVVFYGRGAGKLPTASAVVADIMDVAKAAGTSPSLTWIDDHKNHVVDYLKTSSGYYICLDTDVQNAADIIEKSFKNVEFLNRENAPKTEFAFIIDEINEQVLLDKQAELESDGFKFLSKIRTTNY